MIAPRERFVLDRTPRAPSFVYVAVAAGMRNVDLCFDESEEPGS